MLEKVVGVMRASRSDAGGGGEEGLMVDMVKRFPFLIGDAGYNRFFLLLL